MYGHHCNPALADCACRLQLRRRRRCWHRRLKRCAALLAEAREKSLILWMTQACLAQPRYTQLSVCRSNGRFGHAQIVARGLHRSLMSVAPYGRLEHMRRHTTMHVSSPMLDFEASACLSAWAIWLDSSQTTGYTAQQNSRHKAEACDASLLGHDAERHTA